MSKLERIPSGDPDVKRGFWKLGAYANSVIMSCSACGDVSYLSGYKIGGLGRVTPKVMCPVGCGFDEHIMLDGWL